MDIIKLSVGQFPEITFPPELFDKLVGEIFSKTVDLAAFFHCFNQRYTISRGEKGGNFADNMFP